MSEVHLESLLDDLDRLPLLEEAAIFNENPCITCRQSLYSLCPNPYPFPTGSSENTRVYAPGFGTIAAKMLRINPNPKKNAQDIFCGRSGYRLGFFRGPLGKSLGIFPVAAREIAWDFPGGRSGYCLGFIRGPLGILLRDFRQRALPNR